MSEYYCLSVIFLAGTKSDKRTVNAGLSVSLIDKNKMEVNINKTKEVNFRRPNRETTKFEFHPGDYSIEICGNYMYKYTQQQKKREKKKKKKKT